MTIRMLLAIVGAATHDRPTGVMTVTTTTTTTTTPMMTPTTTTAPPAPLAFVSGGSSGIGLACARELLRRGYRVVVAARGVDRLQHACAGLEPHGPGRVIPLVLDVADVDACTAAIDRVQAEHGPIAFLLTSAGMCEPGAFLDQPLTVLLQHMQTNYAGTLALVHRVVPTMKAHGHGHIVLVSSAMAFMGIYGYGGYAPSKFALRGLGETLFAELREHGIRVSVAFPPDTDTPQYRFEQERKPAAARVITAAGGLFDADVVGKRIVSQALRGRFGITQGASLTLLRFVHSAISPLFLRWQQRVARITR
jgi:3-dehydrosphinganine reductase